MDSLQIESDGVSTARNFGLYFPEEYVIGVRLEEWEG